MSVYPKKSDTQETAIMPVAKQVEKKGRQRKHKGKSALLVLFLFLCIVGGVLAYGYSYYNTTVQAPLKQFIHPVQRSK